MLGFDVGVTPIKPQTKISSAQLDVILRSVNDVMYFYRNLHINTRARDEIMDTIKVYGKELRGMNLPKDSKVAARRDELIDALLDIYSKVKECPGALADSTKEKMCKYRLAMYLKDKEAGMDEEKKFKWLQDNIHFAKVYGTNERTSSIQNELLETYRC